MIHVESVSVCSSSSTASLPNTTPATTSGEAILPGLSLRLAEGHTGAMMLPQLTYKGRTLVFMADLWPSVAHFPTAWAMAYDMFPLTGSKNAPFSTRLRPGKGLRLEEI
jgi:hypothetical protein